MVCAVDAKYINDILKLAEYKFHGQLKKVNTAIKNAGGSRSEQIDYAKASIRTNFIDQIVCYVCQLQKSLEGEVNRVIAQGERLADGSEETAKFSSILDVHHIGTLLPSALIRTQVAQKPYIRSTSVGTARNHKEQHLHSLINELFGYQVSMVIVEQQVAADLRQEYEKMKLVLGRADIDPQLDKSLSQADCVSAVSDHLKEFIDQVGLKEQDAKFYKGEISDALQCFRFMPADDLKALVNGGVFLPGFKWGLRDVIKESSVMFSSPAGGGNLILPKPINGSVGFDFHIARTLSRYRAHQNVDEVCEDPDIEPQPFNNWREFSYWMAKVLFKQHLDTLVNYRERAVKYALKEALEGAQI
ncbi:hypothetical protein [Magnetococcus sp. PR-3]|uniref:hypothetical protein n=1 Tax=Magnetococcus sp. PR-3 TaxID=3120355 RepID=UPI002FCDEB61